MSNPFPRLAAALTEAMNVASSWRALERAIRQQTHIHIDHVKLAKIANGENKPLRLDEIVAIDQFLARSGLGFLDRPVFWQDVVRAGHVALLVGAYPRIAERRTDVSRWDLLAGMQINSGIDRYRFGVHIEIADILMKRPVLPERLDDSAITRWFRVHGPSVVVLGSPRACLAAERMLAGLWGCEPFSQRVRDSRATPFAFIWPEAVAIPSSFSTSNDGSIGFRLGNDVYIETDSDQPRFSYSVVAGAKQKSGAVHLLVSGTTGPATFAAARALASDPGFANLKFADFPGGFWAVVKAQIYTKPNVVGDDREVCGVEVVKPPSTIQRI